MGICCWAAIWLLAPGAAAEHPEAAERPVPAPLRLFARDDQAAAADRLSPLGPPSDSPRRLNRAGRSGTAGGAAGAMLSTAGALAIVLGLLLVLAWLARRAQPAGTAKLPADVLQPLGRAPLTARQQLQLVRFGPKLVLLAVSPDGAETLSEIDDPEQVASLTAQCHAAGREPFGRSFRQVLDQIGRGPAPEAGRPAGRTSS